eukprot:TRINITY_DN3948_c0_g1_i1.p2 TRINITY_DN3948_c0_g1~~TRINITY_DN3948_c0_g1_i1.p2  ORF type:complete len:125 (-),score=57.33 TRINITY_DN3948_c0_g1_i1:447-821(-)
MHIRTGFALLLDRVEDTLLDVPDAASLLGTFLARAVVDDILPPAFLKKAPYNSKAAQAALTRASALLADDTCERLEAIWGRAATQSVGKIKESFDDLLQEFVASGDNDEASRCLRELGVPHFSL